MLYIIFTKGPGFGMDFSNTASLSDNLVTNLVNFCRPVLKTATNHFAMVLQ